MVTKKQILRPSYWLRSKDNQKYRISLSVTEIGMETQILINVSFDFGSQTRLPNVAIIETKLKIPE